MKYDCIKFYSLKKDGTFSFLSKGIWINFSLLKCNIESFKHSFTPFYISNADINSSHRISPFLNSYSDIIFDNSVLFFILYTSIKYFFQ